MYLAMCVLFLKMDNSILSLNFLIVPKGFAILALTVSNVELPVLGATVVMIETAVEDTSRIQRSVFYGLPVSKASLLYVKSQVEPVEGEGRWEQAELGMEI